MPVTILPLAGKTLMVHASVPVDAPTAQWRTQEWFDDLVRNFIGTLECLLADGCSDAAIDAVEEVDD